MPIADKMQMLSKGGRYFSLFFLPVRAKEVAPTFGATGRFRREDDVYVPRSERREKLSTSLGLRFTGLLEARECPKHLSLKGDGTEVRDENYWLCGPEHALCRCSSRRNVRSNPPSTTSALCQFSLIRAPTRSNSS